MLAALFKSKGKVVDAISPVWDAFTVEESCDSTSLCPRGSTGQPEELLVVCNDSISNAINTFRSAPLFVSSSSVRCYSTSL